MFTNSIHDDTHANSELVFKPGDQIPLLNVNR